MPKWMSILWLMSLCVSFCKPPPIPRQFPFAPTFLTRTQTLPTFISAAPALERVDEERDLKQIGRNMVAAGYVLYGPSVVMVMTIGGGTGVHGFTLDPSIGEFVLSHEDMKIPGPSHLANGPLEVGCARGWRFGSHVFGRVVALCPASVRLQYVLVPVVHRQTCT